MMGFYIIFILPIISAILTNISFTYLNLFVIAWISLTPYLLANFLSTNLKTTLLVNFIFGLAFYLLNLLWLRFISYWAIIPLAIYFSIYYVIFGLVFFILRNRLKNRIFLSVPFIWVAIEYAKSKIFGGFPWFLLCYTQAENLALIQIVKFTGCYFISFLVVCFNTMLTYRILKLIRKERMSVKFAYWAIAFAVSIAFILLYGITELKKTFPVKLPNVSVVQANIPQDIKEVATIDDNYANKVLAKHLDLTSKLKYTANLIIWSETSFPYLVNTDKGSDNVALDALKDISQKIQGHFLVGAVRQESQKLYNSVFYFYRGKLKGYYDKVHLVPFGEYVPLSDTVPWLRNFLARFVPEVKHFSNLSSGKEEKLFSYNGYKFGVLICFEIIFPKLVRMLAQRGAKFIVNMSNEGWFKESSALDQLLAISKFRAIENEISIIRATNTGISAFIQPNGKTIILERAGLKKNIEGVLTSSIAINPNKPSGWFFDFGFFAFLCVSYLLISLFLLKY